MKITMGNKCVTKILKVTFFCMLFWTKDLKKSVKSYLNGDEFEFTSVFCLFTWFMYLLCRKDKHVAKIPENIFLYRNIKESVDISYLNILEFFLIPCEK